MTKGPAPPGGAPVLSRTAPRRRLTAGLGQAMLHRTPQHVRDCLERAADCRRRADDVSDPEVAAFWLAQEARWVKIAASEGLSARVATFLELPHDKTFSPEAEEGVQALVGIFDRGCRALELDLSDDAHARKIARTLIEAALGGESYPDRLFARAVTAVSS